MSFSASELYDDDFLLGDSNSKVIEVVPEMLDYTFVEETSDADELRAVFRALKKGEYGRFPDLENTVKAKLVELLPEADKTKALAVTPTGPSLTEANAQKERLADWLANNSLNTGLVDPTPSPIPVRAVTNTAFGNEIGGACPPPQQKKREKADIFRKEKLSTKEYFERWSRFDVDAALESSDDESAVNDDRKHQSCGNNGGRMVIHEVDGVSDGSDDGQGEYDYVKEIYTPGALDEAGQNSTQGKCPSTFSVNNVTTQKVNSIDSDDTKASESWSKISIVETSDSDEEAPGAMRRIDIVEEDSDSEEESHSEECQRAAAKLKEEGNAAMKQGDFLSACKFYSLVLEKSSPLDPTYAAALNNRSIAYIKMEEYSKAIIDANSCLKIELDGNTKALYRRGFAKMKMGFKNETNIKEALDDFQLALTFSPPKDQIRELSKKVKECQELMSTVSRLSSAKGSKKVRNVDSQSLSF
ncbi:hypothetical protein ACHAWF_013063 [Thalassiosira exigua]